MTPDQFLERCPSLWHVAPPGAWERIRVEGFRTAEQLVASADLDHELRTSLLTTPRRESTVVPVAGADITLRDHGPLLAKQDLASILGEGLSVEEWIGLLNRRVYFFADRAAMTKLVQKYAPQDLLVLSPYRLLAAADGRIELADQKTGAIARRAGTQKSRDTFVPLRRFPNKRPAEVTVVDGLDASAVVRVERIFADGSREPLSV